MTVTTTASVVLAQRQASRSTDVETGLHRDEHSQLPLHGTDRHRIAVPNQVTRMYIRRLVMPNDPTGDALHLAVASVHKVDVLLTWNCRHLANPNKFDHIRAVNGELGLPTPILTTPVNFLSGEEHHG